MSELPQTIERKELKSAAMDPRMTQNHGFFFLVSGEILRARGFEYFDGTLGCYDLEKGTEFLQIEEGIHNRRNGNLRYSLAERFTRKDEKYGVIIEARFTTFGDFNEGTNFRPIFRSLVGNLGVHSSEIIHSTDLSRFQENGKHPSEVALDLGYITQTPTKFGDLYMLGLKPIQNLARMVSEKLA